MYFAFESYQNLKALDIGIKYSTMCDIGSLSMDYIVVESGSVEDPIIHKKTDEIIYLLEGELEANVGGQIKSIKKGDVVVIKKGISHTFSNASGKSAILISVCNPSYDPKDVFKV